MKNIQTIFDSFTKIKVGVIGDVMLDTYWWGKVNRISPEAPVPVVSLNTKEERLGGAGNVALNLQSLGATVHILSITGDDVDGNHLSSLLKKNNIHTDYLLQSSRRVTTNKIRIIAKNQHMMRLDAEATDFIHEADEQLLLDKFAQYIENVKPHIVILEDYNKGIFTKNMIHAIVQLCKDHQILTAVDPKRINFFEFQQVDIFKPNLSEAKEALNLFDQEISPEILNNIHLALRSKLNHQISLITLSEKGIFYQSENQSSVIPTHVRNIADVSGAGDTVIAVAALVYAATKDIPLMASLANIAGGLVCEQVGTVAIDKHRLMKECESIL